MAPDPRVGSGEGTSMQRLITVLASVGVVVALWLLPAQAQTDLNRSTLKGLTGVQVVVENMAPALEAVGLRRDRLKCLEPPYSALRS